ncbi:MAG: hypothetical protein FWE97_03550, partial [Dehalococcoidia bacterium]|nr:hypothetical protein [Dehalococcoidia bacterium]
KLSDVTKSLPNIKDALNPDKYLSKMPDIGGMATGAISKGKDSVLSSLPSLGNIKNIPQGVTSMLSQVLTPAAQPNMDELLSADAFRPLAEELGRIVRESAWNEHERRGWY